MGRGWKDVWSTEECPAGLFDLYTHCSGMLYSFNNEHYFIPNPFATVPISPDLFKFASVPKLELGGETRFERGPLIHDTGEPRPHVRKKRTQ